MPMTSNRQAPQRLRFRRTSGTIAGVACYRCLVVITAVREDPKESIGVCRRCGSLACDRDGELDRDYPEFICALCEPERLTRSSTIPPYEPPPGGGGGGVPRRPLPDPFSPSGGGAAAYVSQEDFERRRPGLAAESSEHRQAWHDDFPEMLEHLKQLGVNETMRALVSSESLGDELDPEGVRRTALLLSDQIEAAKEKGSLDVGLLSAAFGLAAWVIGADPRGEATAAQLAHLRDPRLRVVLGLSALRVSL
jgi:hypothetical protein